jgi:hypothetical protein
MNQSSLIQDSEQVITISLPLYRIHNLLLLTRLTAQQDKHDASVFTTLNTTGDKILSQVISQFPGYATYVTDPYSGSPIYGFIVQPEFFFKP